MQQREVIEGEVAAAGEQEAADDKRNHPDEDERAEDIGSERVKIACQAERVEGERDEAVDRVDQIHQDIESEAVEDEGVEEADPPAFAEGAALRERGDDRVADASRQIVKPGVGICTSGDDAAVDAVESARAQCERDQSEKQKRDSVAERKQRRS